MRGQLLLLVREDAVLRQGRVAPARLQRRKHVRTAQRAQPAQERRVPRTKHVSHAGDALAARFGGGVAGTARTLQQPTVEDRL